MSKFKTRGGKTVVFDTEAIGIDDPLLGSGMAFGGKRVQIKKIPKGERRFSEKHMQNKLARQRKLAAMKSWKAGPS